jgi:hypothetical protein
MCGRKRPQENAGVSKPFVRAAPDRTRRIRYAVQLAFLLLNLWIGVEFYRFVRHYETGGATAWVARPGGIEGWLPIAALMNLKVALVHRTVSPL